MRAWDQFLVEQEKEIGLETVNKWLRSLQIMRFDAGNLYLQAKDAFQILWFEEHIRKKVQESFVNNNHRRIKIHLSLNEQAEAPTQAKKKREKGKETNASNNALLTAPEIVFDTLKSFYTFDHFIHSPQHLAYKVLATISGYEPSKNTEPLFFNPIYLSGPHGSGKSHLLMATAHALRQKGHNVVYVHAETFTDHVVKAIRAGDMTLFRQSYRNVDALIIDDVHLFGKKWATQEELFHTFNTLHLANKQILLSADSSPGELQSIEPRLVSRFEWGIIITLEAIPKESFKQILEAKSLALQYPLNTRVLAFLLETFKNGTKSLCHALETLAARTRRQSVNPRSTQFVVPFVKQQLEDLILQEQQATLTPTKIIQRVSEQFGISVDDIVGKAQTRECVLPRQIAMYLCRSHLGISFPQIATVFSRDHSTVMSSVRLIQKALTEANDDINGHLNAIQKKLKL
jgi:chromosomal replication initiator protein